MCRRKNQTIDKNIKNEIQAIILLKHQYIKSQKYSTAIEKRILNSKIAELACNERGFVWPLFKEEYKELVISYVHKQILRELRSHKKSLLSAPAVHSIAIGSGSIAMSPNSTALGRASTKQIYGREGFLDDTKPVQLTSAKAKEIAQAAEDNNPTKIYTKSFIANKHKF